MVLEWHEMIHLSRKTDYALVALAHLAGACAQSGPVSAKEVATAVGLPEPVTQAVLKGLSQAGIICSTRGSSGGYEFLKTPQEISILSVVETIEGTVQLSACCVSEDESDQGDCRLEKNCRIAHGIRSLHGRIVQLLEQSTLADLLNSQNCSDPLIPLAYSGQR